MTKLYYAQGACSLAPHIVLEWIGKPYEAEKVQFGSDALRALNPAGAVPILQEDDGWILTQNSAILDYLAKKHPEAKLDGAGDPRREAEVHRWASFIASELHTSFWPVFRAERFTIDASDSARKAVVEAGLARVRVRLLTMDKHLAGREWLVDRRTYADAYCFPMIRWAAAKLPEGLQAFPNVKALHDRLAADAAVKAVLAKEAAA